MVAQFGVETYTVGWIAALVHERAAATALLDERHDPPGELVKNRHDDNEYTWGSMGAHNVVIASLPVGEYGTNIAAAVAKSMLGSLPSIRIGLMVGIGAGIPNIDEDYDIRLGDIVVCQPQGRSGGVIQYDLVKAKEGRLHPTGMLNMPPAALRSALAKLRAEHELRPSKIPQLLEDMLERYPLMRKSTKSKPPGAYVHPGFEHDVYYVGPEAEGPLEREPRDSTDPEIHYGTIASGNMLVKDAAERNAILERLEGSENIICLEMEAAGLMNNFPCLVIRGICDYADQNKSDKWQKYAAATAAAFAKEFLSHVDASDIKHAASLGELKDLVQEGQ
ncbi:hypothetical protein HII31_12236 [Pseudocercospora fuligena]|uniref:Nucleoside phosphorylase domain-containing protein n=1 Tax=Pseudocercospora fuligena TaxID=685502 RepID=A0A8H6VGW7_9PEZI|nr:hypothetical protein HII31_12236 [Pseudocercospora fuligena]